MSRRRPKDQQEEAPIGDANVLPVMNIMFLLIPALLLAMEVASMAAVAISPPKHALGSENPPPDDPDTKPLNLTVEIRGDGFAVRGASQQLGAEAGRDKDSALPTIPLAKPDAPSADYERYDYAALEQLVAAIKQEYPRESVVTVTAENDIPAQVLITTLDAVRGFDCKLGEADDEEVPSECLFFRPIVSAG